MIEYQVKLIQFPNNKVHESVIENEDGSYTIFIDASLSYEEQRNSFNHAIKHIYGCDFYKINVDIIEHNAHMKISI